MSNIQIALLIIISLYVVLEMVAKYNLNLINKYQKIYDWSKFLVVGNILALIAAHIGVTYKIMNATWYLLLLSLIVVIYSKYWDKRLKLKR